MKEMSVLTLLGIDTSGKTASVALCTEDKVLAQTTFYTTLTHSQVILPICNDVLENAGMELSNVDGVAVAMGPGSYTGLRIGISAVKAICFAQNKPCIGISTLEGLANNVSLHNGIICTVMTARLDLVYCAVFESDGYKVTRLTDDEILPLAELKEKLAAFDGRIVVVGDAADKLEGQNFIIAPPHLKLQLATGLCSAAFDKEMSTPDKLDAAYLQITKAEKDLQEK